MKLMKIMKGKQSIYDKFGISHKMILMYLPLSMIINFPLLSIILNSNFSIMTLGSMIILWVYKPIIISIEKRQLTIYSKW